MLKKLSLDGIDSDVVLDAELTAAYHIHSLCENKINVYQKINCNVSVFSPQRYANRDEPKQISLMNNIFLVPIKKRLGFMYQC